MPYKTIQTVATLTLVSMAGLAQANREFDCLIEPTQMVDIASPVVGLLSKVNVRRGDRVTKGQVLAELESRAEQATAELARFKSEMSSPTRTAESKIEFFKKKYSRRKELQSEDLISQQDRDDAESEMKLAEHELQLARENRQLAKLEWQQQTSFLSLRVIRSPFDGVVARQFLYPGEIIEPSAQKKPILKLAQLDPLLVHVILPSAAFGKVKVGMEAEVTPEIPIGGRYKGKVKIVDRLIDAASGTFGTFVEVPNPTLEIPAGVKCRATLPIASETARETRPGKNQPNKP
jgi:RND family efflux transporter MFP subunit